MTQPLSDDEKDEIALYVKKLNDEEEDRRNQRILRYTAIGGLFAAALATAFGWAMLKSAETAAIDTVRGDQVSKITTDLLTKALKDSNDAIDVATSAKRAAASAQQDAETARQAAATAGQAAATANEAAATSATSFKNLSEKLDASEKVLGAVHGIETLANDVSNNHQFQNIVTDQVLASISTNIVTLGSRISVVEHNHILDTGVFVVKDQVFKDKTFPVKFANKLEEIPRIMLAIQGFREGLGGPGQVNISASLVGQPTQDGFNMEIFGAPSDVYDIIVLWIAIGTVSK